MQERYYSREETSENVNSSGMEHFQMSKAPIGVIVENTESGNLGLALSSKPLHKTNKEIVAMHSK